MMTATSVNVVMLAVFYNHVLQHIGHILASIDGGLEKVVNLLQLDEGDRVLLLIEQVGYCGASDTVGLVLQTVDFDAVIHDGPVRLESDERGGQRLGTRRHDFAER